MPVDLIKLHEKTYGYCLRTGLEPNYKYWFRDYSNGKLYAGKKPSDLLIENFDKNEHHPNENEITPNPWQNYNSRNTQMISSKESNVPYNKLGITNRDEIEMYESFLLSICYRKVFENLKTFPDYYLPITTKKINFLHKKIFSELYDWAGEYRNINISKDGFPFPPHDTIEKEMQKLDNKIFKKINYAKQASLEDLSELLAIIAAEMNIIHPYREGNGRLIRFIQDIISISYGFQPLDWGILNSINDRQLYLQYMFEGYRKNYQPLAKFTYNLLASVNY